jgi:hypothetical protein
VMPGLTDPAGLRAKPPTLKDRLLYHVVTVLLRSHISVWTSCEMGRGWSCLSIPIRMPS